MINPKANLFKWGPLDARIIYVDTFAEEFVRYKSFFGVGWPDILAHLKDDKTLFIADYEHLWLNGGKLFSMHDYPSEELNKIYADWIKTTHFIEEHSVKINKGLKNFSDKELHDSYVSFYDNHADFWMYGFLPELANWGGENILKNKLLEFNRDNFIEIFEGLSAPEDLSFFQKEELAFMKIKIEQDHDKQEKMLTDHQKKYYWLRNSYGYTRMLDVNFFRQELKKITLEQANKKIREINDYVKNVKKRKKELITKYSIPKDIVDVAFKLSYFIWWQDYRKQFIFMACHIQTIYLKEISRRKNISFDDLCYYRSFEIIRLLAHDEHLNLDERKKGVFWYYNENKNIEFTEGEKANELIKPYIDVNIDINQKEIKGVVVSKGKNPVVKGKVCILMTPRNLEKMNQGDILVTSMTSPDFIIAMKKASAIVTDEGGMTSHAAIVSRELKIPCIVGTRIATKIFKDGDYVEVDADKGIVRKAVSKKKG